MKKNMGSHLSHVSSSHYFFSFILHLHTIDLHVVGLSLIQWHCSQLAATLLDTVRVGVQFAIVDLNFPCFCHFVCGCADASCSPTVPHCHLLILVPGSTRAGRHSTSRSSRPLALNPRRPPHRTSPAPRPPSTRAGAVLRPCHPAPRVSPLQPTIGQAMLQLRHTSPSSCASTVRRRTIAEQRPFPAQGHFHP